jgi:hypothetical protein
MISCSKINGIELLTIESKELLVSLAPALGGKITSIFNKDLAKEFLWVNDNLPLTINEPGADYDTNFFGGIDELLPSDMPETVDSIEYPDHGELWTTALEWRQLGEQLLLWGKLPLARLSYSKTVSLSAAGPEVNFDYSLTNETGRPSTFLWKLHAAVRIAPGDRLISGAKHARVVDPAYSRFTDQAAFTWPFIQGTDASVIPVNNGSMDFFYLYDGGGGTMALLTAGGEQVFRYRYDPGVFPYQWWFASYGGFLNHYTAILEPCTNMPMSINEARSQGQSLTLGSGETLNTRVTVYAGSNERSQQ